MIPLDIDWEWIEAGVMFASVCGTIVAGYVAMRKDRRGDEAIWSTIGEMRAELAQKANTDSLYNLHVEWLRTKAHLITLAGEIDAAQAAEEEQEHDDETA